MSQVTLLIGLLLLIGCTFDNQEPIPPLAPAWVDQARLAKADAEPDQWLTSGRDFKLQHYSPLDQVNPSNVAQLGFAWEYPISYRGRVQYTLEATPHMVDGVLYTSGPWGTVYAVDALSGKEIWRYDPDVDGNWARRPVVVW